MRNIGFLKSVNIVLKSFCLSASVKCNKLESRVFANRSSRASVKGINANNLFPVVAHLQFILERTRGING